MVAEAVDEPPQQLAACVNDGRNDEEEEEADDAIVDAIVEAAAQGLTLQPEYLQSIRC